MLELGKETRIRELIGAGYGTPEVLRQMREEGAPTSKQEVYKVKHRMKREGYVFPEAAGKPSGGLLEAGLKPIPSKGKGSRSPEARYRRMINRITQKNRDLEFAVATQPEKIPDYAVEVFSKIEQYSEGWERFRAMVGDGSVRDAIREALTLVPSYERLVAIEAANGRPPPKIAPYVRWALDRWMKKFKEEKRGMAVPRGRANPYCRCGSIVVIYFIRSHQGSRPFKAWCPSCHEERTWQCTVCGSRESGLVDRAEPCVGCEDCGHVSDFTEPVEFRCPQSVNAHRLWSLLVRSLGTLRLEACWSVLRQCEELPDTFANPHKLFATITRLSGPYLDLAGVWHPSPTAIKITSEFFGFDYRPPSHL